MIRNFQYHLQPRQATELADVDGATVNAADASACVHCLAYDANLTLDCVYAYADEGECARAVRRPVV